MSQTIEFVTTTPGTFRVTFDVAFEPKPDDPPPPPPPPPVTVKKAYEVWHKVNQSLGSPSDAATPWSDHTTLRTRIPFSAVEVLFANPWSSARTIVNHMIGLGASGGLLAAQWHAGAGGVVVPAGQGASTAQRNGHMSGGVVSCAPIAAADGGPAHVMLRADLLGCVWHSSPDGWTQAAWDAAYPQQPMHSWVRYNSHAATPALAASVGANGWIAKPGMRSVGGLILHHASPAASVLYFGDSTTDADLNMPGVCNYQSPGWRSVNTMAARGVPVTFGRMCQGGAKWDDILYQAQQAAALGLLGAGSIAVLPTHTSNDANTASGHWARSQQLVSIVQAAGGTPALVGPMCSTTHDQTRLDVRALMLASGLACVDTGAVIGLDSDPSVFAPGMCGDPAGYAVHPSNAANAALASAHDAMLTGVIG